MENCSLLTDFYQLTMAQSYWKAGFAEKRACFQLSFRRAPFKGRYAIACGLEPILAFIEKFQFTKSDLVYLESLKVFEVEFLNYLSTLRLTCDVDAMHEGTIAFPNEPMLRVTGPILQAQLLETALLNMMNFQSLIATKASRIRFVAANDEVIEFGLRRAQGFDGGLSASRASFLGGCDATSHVLAAKQFGIPLRGTLAHSWVMAFDNERSAFATYAEVSPGNYIFPVDTYNSLEGVRNAMRVGPRLAGIRLDSGNLEELSKAAREILNEAGFRDTKIIASGDIDENKIMVLKKAKAPIDVWGVGTRLVTAHDDPALGGIYKLTALYENDTWKPCVKVSDDEVKKTLPGVLQVRRYTTKGRFAGDFIYDIYASKEPLRTEFEDLVVPYMRAGKRLHTARTMCDTKNYIAKQLLQLDDSVKDLTQPAPYRVDFDEVLLLKR